MRAADNSGALIGKSHRRRCITALL